MMALANWVAIRMADFSPRWCRTNEVLRSTLSGVQSAVVRFGTSRYSFSVRDTSSRIFKNTPEQWVERIKARR